MRDKVADLLGKNRSWNLRNTKQFFINAGLRLGTWIMQITIDECALDRQEEAVFLFQIVTRCYVKNGTCSSESREYSTYGRTDIKAKTAGRSCSIPPWFCLLLAAISPVRHAKWFHLCSSALSSSNDRTMEMAVLSIWKFLTHRKDERRRKGKPSTSPFI